MTGGEATSGLGAVREVSAFFPCYNDEPTIGRMVTSVHETLERLGIPHDITVVDDASSDGSRAVLHALQQTIPELRVVEHPENRGYGGALLSGLAAARRQWVFYTDGDAQYDPNEIEQLIALARDDIDVVQGYKIRRSDPLKRKIIGRVYHHTVALLFGLHLRDVDCDFRLMRREVLDAIELHNQSGVICVELMRKLQDADARVVQTPVSHHPRLHGRSQFFQTRRIARSLYDLGVLWCTLVVLPKIKRK
jgi:glycosyltransferase involved in cell wall biosynthesis